MRLRRDRFAALVARQLDLFAEDEAGLLREAEDALDAYGRAPADEAEELYGDYQLVLEAVADRLGELCHAYGSTLDEDARAAYGDSFDRAARKRFPAVAGFL